MNSRRRRDSRVLRLTIKIWRLPARARTTTSRGTASPTCRRTRTSSTRGRLSTKSSSRVLSGLTPGRPTSRRTVACPVSSSRAFSHATTRSETIRRTCSAPEAAPAHCSRRRIPVLTAIPPSRFSRSTRKVAAKNSKSAKEGYNWSAIIINKIWRSRPRWTNSVQISQAAIRCTDSVSTTTMRPIRLS